MSWENSRDCDHRVVYWIPVTTIFTPVLLNNSLPFLLSPLSRLHLKQFKKKKFPNAKLASQHIKGFWSPILILIEEGKQFLTPAGCSKIELNSDIIYLKILSDSTGQGAKSYKTFSPTPELQTLVTNYHLCFSPTSYRSEVPMTPSLCLINLLEWPTELRKPVYSLDYRFITKDIKGYRWTSRWKRCIGQCMEKGRWASMPSPDHHPPLVSTCSPT